MPQNFTVIQGNHKISESRVFFNNNFETLKSNFSGGTAPSSPIIGQLWYDTSKNVLKVYNGSDWIVIQSDIATIVPSAATVNIGDASVGSVILITGTTNIISFGNAAQAGMVKVLIFSGALTITHSANSLVLPTEANITTSAGDMFIAIAESTTKWRLFSNKYFKDVNVVGSLAVNGNTTLGDAGTDLITITGNTVFKNTVLVKSSNNTDVFKVDSSGVSLFKYSPKVINSGASLTINPSIASYWDITVNDNTILNFVNGTSGDIMYVNIKQNSAGGKIITYTGNVYLKYLPQTPNASVLYKLEWYKNNWVANVIYTIDIFNTNMLTHQEKQNPFKESTVDNIVGWTIESNLLRSISYTQAVVTKNRVYLLGGWNNSPLATVYTAPINQDGTLGSWATGPSLPGPLFNSQVLITKNRIYLLGGATEWANTVSTVYTAPINSDGTIGTWAIGPSLPGPLRASQVVVTKNRVYLLGGSSTWPNATSTVYTAPINSDGTIGTWAIGPSLPGPLRSSQSIVIKNRVYLLGGSDGSSIVSTVYTAPINSDGTIGTWAIGPSLLWPVHESQAVVTKNRVYLLGGYNGSSAVSDIYTAPITSDGTIGTWAIGSNLLEKLRASQAIVTKSKIYLLGGSSTWPNITSNVYSVSFADGWEWPNPHSSYYEDNNII